MLQGLDFSLSEVSHDLSGSHNDNTFGPELSSLTVGAIHGVLMNATILVAHYAVTEILLLFETKS